MHILKRHGWEIPEHQATSESAFLNRRSLMAAAGIGLGTLAAAPALAAKKPPEVDPTASLYPVKRNEAFTVERALTEERIAAGYNNFYEFGFTKYIADDAQALPLRPWTVTVDGMVENKQVIDIDTLIRKMPLEERLSRFRCVEAWAMTVPWSGFPLKELVALAKPLSSAKFLRFETFMDPKVAFGQKQPLYPWPYVEGVTMEEANNDLAFIATGVYGKPLAKQFGAPLRLVLPWKYGFKSIKSIVKVTFTDKRPVGLWEALQDSEYGFWANVNPEVPHPRWSQASENIIGSSERQPTKLFNGYGAFVADLYKGKEKEKLWM
jgi:sulfoxide reductase catalytic subunit YedY